MVLGVRVPWGPFYLRRGTSRQVYKSILSPSFLPFFLLKGSKKHLGPREALELRLLGPLSSELRSEVTSEATGSLRGHFQRNSHSSGSLSQLFIAPSFLLHSLVVKVSDFGARGPWFESHLWQSKNFSQ